MGIASRVLWRTVLKNASGWTFMVNYGGGRGREREMGRFCGKTVVCLKIK